MSKNGKKKAKKVSVKSKGKPVAARAKSHATTGGTTGFQKVVLTATRIPAEGEVPPQAAVILGILAKSPGGLTPGELVEKMKGKVQSKQSLRAVLNLYRAKLQKQGFLGVAPLEKEEAAAA